MALTRVLSVIGTRPEVIKMAPVIRELRARPTEFHSLVCLSGQHREMVDQILGLFSIQPDYDLDVMTHAQSLSVLTALLFQRLQDAVTDCQPDWILAQGDTTSVLVSGLVAYYNKVRFGHVEAGLRTGDKARPFPEEMNRIVADHAADLLFAPTDSSRRNLLFEGISESKIVVTGNTIVDSLATAISFRYDWYNGPLSKVSRERRIVLITAHRRESFGDPLDEIVAAVRELAVAFDAQFVFPVHRNPNVRAAVDVLSDLANVQLLEPLDYFSLINLVSAADLILTDSGGIQEEAPSFGVPVLVMRERTERPEGLAHGLVKLVGSSKERIVTEAAAVLRQPMRERSPSLLANPYGDGRAANRIVDALSFTHKDYDRQCES